jgi:hypothetical protein
MSGSALSRGRSTCSQGLPLPHPRFRANLKIECRNPSAFPIVFADLPSAAFEDLGSQQKGALEAPFCFVWLGPTQVFSAHFVRPSA